MSAPVLQSPDFLADRGEKSFLCLIYSFVRSCSAVLFLGSVRPLNSIGSQALVFLRPFLSGPFNGADYDRMTAILDRREGIGALVEAIEAADTMNKGPTK